MIEIQTGRVKKKESLIFLQFSCVNHAARLLQQDL